MTDGVDFFQVLKAISTHPELFSAAAGVVRVSVGKIVGVALENEALDLPGLLALRSLIGPEALEEAVDGIPAAKIKALVMHVDPHVAGLSTAPLRTQHLLALADGSAKPSVPAAKKTARRGGKAKVAPAARPAASAEAAPSTTGAEPADAAPKPRKRRMSGRTALTVSEKRKA